MTSVWKRLQRVGKDASKFQFTASYQSLTVECVRSGKWQPNKLIVVWTRRKRRKATKPQSWQPGISNPFRGVLVWPEPVCVEVVVTLYKDSRPDSEFEDKEWTFVIEDESVGGRRKPIATASINMADYASTCYSTVDVSLTMKIASKKVLSAKLDLQLSSILLKEGKATDADMMSIASMMSLNDVGNLDDFDDETEENLALRLGRVRRTSHVDTPSPVLKAKVAGDRGSNSASPVAPARRKHSRSGSLTPTKDRSLTRQNTGSDDSGSTASAQELAKERSHAETALIDWCKSCTQGYAGVKIKNVTTSFRDGLALCAILHHFRPDLIDFDSLEKRDVQGNNEKALDLFSQLGVPRLLDPTDMMLSRVPDKLSVMTYLFQVRTLMTSAPQKPAELSPPAPADSGAPNPILDDDATEMEEEDSAEPVENKLEGDSPASQEKSPSPFHNDTSALSAETEASAGEEVEKLETRTTESRNDKMNEAGGQDGPANTGLTGSTPSYPGGLNPFDEEEEEKFTESESSDKNVKSGKSALNPFEEDGTDDDQHVETDTKLKVRGSYPKDFNPFDEEDDCADSDGDEAARKRESYPDDLNPFGSDDSTEETEQSEDAVSPGYNPFDEEEPKPRRPVLATRHVATRGVATPSGKTTNKNEVPEQRSPGKAEAAEADNPWTARLPDKPGSRRSRQARASPAKSEPRADSPAKRSAPRRPAPRPPRPKEAVAKETTPKEGGDGGGGTAEKPPKQTANDEQLKNTGDEEAGLGSSKDDIKLRAHQLLMEARKKAGASSALPRERLAEIRAQKVRREEGDGQPDEKRNETEGTSASPALPEGSAGVEANVESPKIAQARPAGKEVADTTKAATSKAGDPRPVRPGATTAAKGKRRAPAPPSTANKNRGGPGNKPEFEESEELRRIRSILNQSKAVQETSESTASQRNSSKTQVTEATGSQDQSAEGDGTAAKSPRGVTYGLGHAAAAEAYAETRKMKFDSAVVIAPRHKPQKRANTPDGGSGPSPQPMVAPPPKPPRLFIAENERKEDEASKDKVQAIRGELKALEDEQQALDKVAGKLEKELRTAMGSKGCRDEEERLMQEWLLLINKKNDLVGKQNELALLEKESLLEQRIEQLNSELRILLEKEDSKKTESERRREDELIKEIVALVDQKDHLVRLEDSASPEPTYSVEQVRGVLAKQKNECVVQ